MKRGYILTMDAVMALVVALAVFTLIIGIQNSIKTTERAEFKRIHYIAEDAVEALNKKGVLDEIGTQWALSEGNSSSPHWVLAANISQRYLSSLIPSGMGYKLLIDDDEIFRYEGVPESGASSVTRSARMLSGYLPGKPVLGYTARAYFTQIRNKVTEKYIDMPYVLHSSTLKSDLYVVYKFELPADAEILSGDWVVNMGSAVRGDMYLNGNHVKYLPGCTAVYKENVTKYLKPGTNTAQINTSKDQYYGSYIVVRYRTAGMYEGLSFRQNLPYLNSTERSTCSCDWEPCKGWYICYQGYACCGANNHTAMFTLKVPVNFRGQLTEIKGRIHARGLNNFLSVIFNSVPIKRVDFSYNSTGYEYVMNLSTSDFVSAGIDLNALSGKDNWLDIYVDSDCNTAYDSVELLDDSYIEFDYDPDSPIGYGEITFGKSAMINSTAYNCPLGIGWNSWEFKMDIPENSSIYDVFHRGFYACDCMGKKEHYAMYAWSDAKPRQTLYYRDSNQVPPIWYFYDGTLDHSMGYFHFPPEYISQGGEDRHVLYWRYTADDPAYMCIRYGSLVFASYTVRGYVPYGDPKPKANGCNLTVWYDYNQDGIADGSVNISVGENPDDYDPENDAVDDAVMRLLDELNFYNDNPNLVDGSHDNPVDVEIIPEMNLESSNVGDVRSMWGPAVLKLVVWM